MSKKSLPPILVDYRMGSKNLALYPPLRDLLTPCTYCSSQIGSSWRLNRATGIYYNKDSKGKEIKPSCPKCYDTGRTLTTLSSGDVSFIGNDSEGSISIGVEVKSISDLLTSISNGRLQDTQIMSGMVNDYHPNGRWILHYGLYRPSPVDGSIQEWKDKRPYRDEGWYTLSIGDRVAPYSYLENFKVTPPLLELGFHVVRVNSIIEAAHWLVSLYETWTKPYHTHKSMRTLDRSQDIESMLKRSEEASRRDRVSRHSKSGLFTKGQAGGGIGSRSNDEKFMARLRTAFTFPSLGFERAKAIAGDKRFSSVMDMMHAAEADDLFDIEMEVGGEVDGSRRRVKIGKAISRRVKEYVT